MDFNIYLFSEVFSSSFMDLADIHIEENTQAAHLIDIITAIIEEDVNERLSATDLFNSQIKETDPNYTPFSTSMDKTKNYLNEISNALESFFSEGNNDDLINELNEMTELVSRVIREDMGVLKGDLQSNMETIRKAITQDMKKHTNEIDIKFPVSDVDDISFNMFDWSASSIVNSPANVRDFVYAQIGYDKASNEENVSDLNEFGRLMFTNIPSYTIDITQRDVQFLKTQLEEENSPLQASSMEKYLEVMCSTRAMQLYRERVKTIIASRYVEFDQLLNYTNELIDMVEFSRFIKKHTPQLSLSEKNLDLFGYGTEFILRLQYYMAYALNYHRNRLKNIVMMDNMTINTDCIKEIKKANLSQFDIAKFIFVCKYIYRTGDGLRSTTVNDFIKMKESIDNAYDHHINAIKSSRAVMICDAIKDCYAYECKQFGIKKEYDSEKLNDVVRRYANRLTDVKALDDSIYAYLLDMEFKPHHAKMHARFRKALSECGNNIDDAALRSIESAVITDCVYDYI